MASFLTGLQSLVLFGAVSDYPPEVPNAYGTSVVITAATTMLGTGATVMVVQRLAEQRDARKAHDALSSIAATVLLATVLLIPLFAVVGVVVLFVDGSGLSSIAYWTQVPGMLTAPILALTSGLLVLEGKQGIQLRVAFENLLIIVAVTVLLPRLELPGGTMLAVMGLLGTALNFSALVRFWGRMGETKRQLRRAVHAGLLELRGSVRPALRQLPTLAAGTTDGLVMMSSYMVIALAASHSGPVAGAATATLISLARTLVIPMKQFGIAGGRLAKTATGPVDIDRRLRLFTGCVAGLLAPLGLVLILFPGVVAVFAGESLSHPDAETATRLLGVQFFLESVAGFGSSALKVLISPGASLRHLAAVMYLFTVPTIVLLSATGNLTLPLLWGTVLVGRTLFSSAVLWIYLRWRRSERSPAS
ncbi:hypothetical protein RM780_26365 [Streptomyces sp. DSM 44917]|uniref:MATE family efflux transporter n=1 Tax=Streptomyces boetiae TaxID=3075541 RepID=A0ABU2LFS6_9ACTN|nr:hypothetical protein [Streptomyces sp. DSM 44917]MDT0310445.1 hypothetical protein [Streptomyces sp. DSM 44917]